DTFEGKGWLNGGTISMYAASRYSAYSNTGGAIINERTGATVASGPGAMATATDISGSILINAGSRLDLKSGGRIDQNGKFQLTPKGGNLSLESDTEYFQVAIPDPEVPKDIAGFRVPTTLVNGGKYLPVNPDRINARITIDPNAIEAHGF